MFTKINKLERGPQPIDSKTRLAVVAALGRVVKKVHESNLETLVQPTDSLPETKHVRILPGIAIAPLAHEDAAVAQLYDFEAQPSQPNQELASETESSTLDFHFPQVS